ncbi:acyl-CoA dehydrogenase family protein [Lentilactobacillus buchneri]|uniref:Acyl-CoA dehydrogenase n=1 Tax=Lentilactobacillus buchneri DSM 20057 TaxID=1423728 RepID=A0A4R5NQV3_LENBU|nr:acyl-CoA dehydrogenase family protein [Lentilactobacillus buchneri]WCJ51143.1 acyl-CoA dehydrogenase family protein [Lentilactobacillus sp. Egmn17]AEB72621.1 Butyryl-CoA dehydrogenase [Lentilactobacillus buchneri NRRL B-30929]MCT3252277.1 acyl-CoA dehydrogenase [Lentilactobacillus buchneri]MCT3546866.1 acyl-CoA dehydrogenase [Lentilactobacillus buchneri]MCT3555351.1 acyl-CoA dehydrogenase [Lentilactobacillus buchneri]
MSITNDQTKMLIQMIKEFTANELAPLDMEIDRAGNYPDGLFQKVVNTGLLGITLPREYGGAAFDYQAAAESLEKMATGNASMAVTLEGHFKTIEQFIKYGNKSLNDEYLPSAAKRIFAFSMTEPSGGSNPKGIATRAIKQGDNWVITGDKIMITNGGLAEVYCVLAKTEDDQMAVFVVDKDMPGFKFGKREDFIGLKGVPVGEVVLNHVVVPDSHLLGRIGQGLEIGDNAHADARVLMGAVLAGIMEHELQTAVNYSKERKAMDTPLYQLQVTQEKIADIAIAKENTTALYQKGADNKVANKPYAEVAAMAKSYGSRSAVASGDKALQILGGYGYSHEYPVEHLIRDARAMELAEGTIEKMNLEITNAEIAK